VRFPLIATIVAGLLAAVAAPVAAQNGAAAARPNVDHGIRVLDVKRVFDEYFYFKDKIKELRDLVKAFETEQMDEAKKLGEEAKKLAEFAQGSPERKALEKKLFQAKTDLEAQAAIKKQEFMEREAKIYYHTYNAIQEEVKYYCQVKGVAAVFSYSSDKADPNNRQSIMRAMGNSVVACDPSIDITETILRVMNRSAPAGSGAPAVGTKQPANNQPPLR
jgi:Skp family chaperone for outer membrane proteins